MKEKKYRLLKDSWDVNAGEVFTYDSETGYYLNEHKEVSIQPEYVENKSDWFGEVKESLIDINVTYSEISNRFSINITCESWRGHDAREYMYHLEQALKWYKEERLDDEEINTILNVLEHEEYEYLDLENEIGVTNKLKQILHNRKEEKRQDFISRRIKLQQRYHLMFGKILDVKHFQDWMRTEEHKLTNPEKKD